MALASIETLMAASLGAAREAQAGASDALTLQEAVDIKKKKKREADTAALKQDIALSTQLHTAAATLPEVLVNEAFPGMAPASNSPYNFKLDFSGGGM